MLDIGCGDGHFASMCFTEKLFAGIDRDENMVKEAGEREVYRHVMAGSATEIPFSSDSFNTIIANCVIEHIQDLDIALTEIHRVLNPGGKFIFGVPSNLFASMLLGSTILRIMGLKSLSNFYGSWFNKHSFHFHTYSPQKWHEILNSHEFAVEKWEYYMTPESHRIFDILHYLSVPHLISRKLTGKWVTFPLSLLNIFFEKWLTPYYLESSLEEGPYIFFHVRKKE